MPDLLIVSGPPGAGKSTIGEVLADRFHRSVLVRGDDYFAHLRRGAIDPWRPSADPQNRVVLAAAAAATGRFVLGGYPTVYEGVLGPWHLPHFVTHAGLERVDYALLLPPLEVVLGRVADRPGHAFTDADAATHMYNEFAQAAVAPRHLVVADGSPDQVADAVEAARAAGWLRLTVA